MEIHKPLINGTRKGLVTGKKVAIASGKVVLNLVKTVVPTPTLRKLSETVAKIHIKFGKTRAIVLAVVGVMVACATVWFAMTGGIPLIVGAAIIGFMPLMVFEPSNVTQSITMGIISGVLVFISYSAAFVYLPAIGLFSYLLYLDIVGEYAAISLKDELLQLVKAGKINEVKEKMASISGIDVIPDKVALAVSAVKGTVGL